jgi:hypothetical protein
VTEQRTSPRDGDDLCFMVTVDEANLVMEALGELPFTRVCELIAKLQAQGRSQLASNGAGAPPDGASEGQES